MLGKLQISTRALVLNQFVANLVGRLQQPGILQAES